MYSLLCDHKGILCCPCMFGGVCIDKNTHADLQETVIPCIRGQKLPDEYQNFIFNSL